MPILKAFCFIDSRRSPEFYSFQRTALTRALKARFSDIRFLALVENPADRNHVHDEDMALVASDLSSLAELIGEIRTRADGFDCVVFSEPNVYPDEKWADHLAKMKRRSTTVSHPARALTLDHQRDVSFYDQGPDDVRSEWMTSLKFCFATKPENLVFPDADLRRYTIGDLRESFVQLFKFGKRDFEAAPNTVVHVVLTHEAHPRSQEGRAGFFCPPTPLTKKERKERGLTIDVLRMKNESAHIGNAPISKETRAEIARLAEFDSRWSRISPILDLRQTVRPFYPEEFLYRSICESIPKADFVMVLHQLRRGGSEKEGILHVRAYRELFPNHKICVILTYPVDPDIEWQLPENVTVVELGKELGSIQYDYHDRSYFLYRILDQLDARTIHVKGSDIGWHALVNFGRVLAAKARLLANLYCVDYVRSGTPISYGFLELPRCARHLTWLLADNQKVLNQMESLTRVPTRRISYPVDLPEKKWTPPDPSEPFRILWCSRLSFQKNVHDLLLAASIFKEYEFHVYGEQSDDLPYINAFAGLPNIKYWGLFDRLEDIDLGRYRCFLYTSFWDGLPNILLEAGALAMPVVSPRVGGIGEILNSKNSYLYGTRAELFAILNNWSEKKATSAAKRLYDDIAANHAWKPFVEECRVIYGS